MYWSLLRRQITILSLFLRDIMLLRLKELGFKPTCGYPTYTNSSLSKHEKLQNHKSVLDIFNIPNKQIKFDLAYLKWII